MQKLETKFFYWIGPQIETDEECREMQAQKIARLEGFVAEYETEVKELSEANAKLQTQIFALEDANGKLQGGPRSWWQLFVDLYT